MRGITQSWTRMAIVLALLLGTAGMFATSAVAVPGLSTSTNGASLALQTTGQSDLKLSVTSSDPDIVNMLGSGSTIRLTEGTQAVFSATVPDSIRQLPRTYDLGGTIPYGTYTLTIDGGDDFEVYTAQVTVNQPTQTINAELEVTDTRILVGRLVEVLKRILRDNFGPTPTPTAAATTVPPTATTVPPTATTVPPTATTAPTNTPVPPADVTSLTVDANPSTLDTGETSTVTVTVTGRAGPSGGRLVVSPSFDGLQLEDANCDGCSSQNGTTGVTEFTYGPSMTFTAEVTYEVTTDSADTYTISVTASETISGENLTRTETVIFEVPPTPVPTNTPVPTPPATITYASESCIGGGSEPFTCQSASPTGYALTCDGDATTTAPFDCTTEFEGETYSYTCSNPGTGGTCTDPELVE